MRIPDHRKTARTEAWRMKPGCLRVLLMLLWCGIRVPAYAQAADPAPAIRFFYSSACQSCAKMKAFLETIVALNPSLPIGLYGIEQENGLW